MRELGTTYTKEEREALRKRMAENSHPPRDDEYAEYHKALKKAYIDHWPHKQVK